MRLTALVVAALCWLAPLPTLAQEAARIVEENRDQIEKPSRQTIGPVIAELAASGDAMADDILSAWADKRLVIRKADDAMFVAQPEGDGFALTALDGSPAGTAAKADLTELKPNAGVRGLIATALVQFTLSDPDPAKRQAALTSIAQDPTAEALEPLRAAIASEEDPTLKAQKSAGTPADPALRPIVRGPHRRHRQFRGRPWVGPARGAEPAGRHHTHRLAHPAARQRRPRVAPWHRHPRGSGLCPSGRRQPRPRPPDAGRPACSPSGESAGRHGRRHPGGRA
jgi:hypothetical protein